MPLLFMIASGLATGFSFIIKHPFVQKMMIFAIFLAVITAAVTYMQSLVSPYIINNSFLSIGAYFGILDGLSLYLTIVLAGFGVKQVLAFIRS